MNMFGRIPMRAFVLLILLSGVPLLIRATSRGTGVDVAAAAARSVDPVLAGAIDIHTHPAPDSQERSADAIDFALLAREQGMRGFVLKQHNDHTAGLAYLVRKAVPGIEVFGVLVLNRAMGGINVAAVERFARTTGGWGRIVSMPTFDASQVAVSADGALLPEVLDVLAAIAEIRTVESNGSLVLATGHATAEECLMLVREARRRGIEHIIVTHPSGRLSIDQMREAAGMGAFLEFTAAAVLVENVEERMTRAAEVIRAVGPESVILSSDLGRADLPVLDPKGLADFAAGLRRNGFSDEELTLMMRDNPARLLGLSPWPE